ncbi:hypothetical protein FGO68_gene11658 [Halteria grandinella]|uniref:Uncharacterized protein n=1 Tax=Halteria grandinella TaxID=5974 RepID=A0A8J8NFG5_HALGN|nr:hypothetical protein FGO68_gene11658 [Halteria grandinella]
MVKTLNFHINSESHLTKFENLGCIYPSTKFIVTFINSQYESFLSAKITYLRLFEDQNCQIDIVENDQIQHAYLLMENLYLELWLRLYLNKITFRLGQIKAYELSKYVEFYNLVKILQDFKSLRAELFQILSLENPFTYHTKIPVICKLQVDSVIIDQ